MLFQLFDEQHLMDVFACESVGSGDDDRIQLTESGAVAQRVEAGTVERGTAVTVVTEDQLGVKCPTLLDHKGLQACKLLFDGLGLCLADR